MNRAVLVFIVFLLFPSMLSARSGKVGLFNSPKGFGVSYVTEVKDGTFNSFDIVADIYGFPTGRTAYYPGVRLNSFHNVVLRDIDRFPEAGFLYAGVGVSTGYVRDFEKFTRWATGPAYLIMNMGAILCVSGQIGIRSDFGNLSLDLSWQADAGLYLRKHETYGNAVLGLYKNGLYNCLLPQLKIMWKF